MTPLGRIKEIAKNKGLSLQKLAEQAGIGVNSIYRWSTKTPSTASLQKVANVLGVSVDYLLGETDEMMPNKKASSDPTEIDLDAALESKGVVMRFQGKELSDKAKRGILDIIKLVDGDED